MKPACKDLPNKDMDIHAGSMAEGSNLAMLEAKLY